jgi:hypothetical protein
MTNRAISLMRAMLRASRDWRGDGGVQEAIFIITETRKVFRERRYLQRGSPECEAALEEGEARLEMARHYAIAYPRMVHTPLSGGGNVKHFLPPAAMGTTEKADWAAHVGVQGVSSSLKDLASASVPFNPNLNAARMRAREKRAAVSRATAEATAEAQEAVVKENES